MCARLARKSLQDSNKRGNLGLLLNTSENANTVNISRRVVLSGAAAELLETELTRHAYLGELTVA